MHHVLDFLVTGEGKQDRLRRPQQGRLSPISKRPWSTASSTIPAKATASDGRTRGGPGSKLPPDAFITYVQNHDQIGNRADGKRLAERTSPDKLDFVHFVKFLAPQIPLCFMGDEGNLDHRLSVLRRPARRSRRRQAGGPLQADARHVPRRRRRRATCPIPTIRDVRAGQTPLVRIRADAGAPRTRSIASASWAGGVSAWCGRWRRRPASTRSHSASATA